MLGNYDAADIRLCARSPMCSGIDWDNHVCMPLRPGDVAFLPQLERVRTIGINVISLNVSFDVVDPRDAFLVLATMRHWFHAHSEHYALVDTVTDIEAAKAQERRTVTFDIEGANAVAAHPDLVEIVYRLGMRCMLFAYNKNTMLGGGCMDEDAALTDYGRQIIDELERIGMVLCCTHVGHRAAREVIAYSRTCHGASVPGGTAVLCRESRRTGVSNKRSRPRGDLCRWIYPLRRAAVGRSSSIMLRIDRTLVSVV